MTRKSLEMALGITLNRSVAESAIIAKRAEDVGFSDIWVSDHYFHRDTYVAQALMAECTDRIRLGTAVTAALLRHPTLIASSTATIDELSGGRAIMGIGVGGFEFAAQLGFRPKSSLAVVKDAIQIARELFGGEANVDGDAFTASGARLGWKTRDIPIYTAARGPRMLELAGEVADGVIIHGLTQAFVDSVLMRIREGRSRSRVGDRVCEVVLITQIEIDVDKANALDHLRPRCLAMAGGSYSDSMIPLLGLAPDDVLRVRDAVRSGDPRAADFVTDPMVEAFAIGGSEAEVVARLHDLCQLGIDRVIVRVPEDADLDGYLDNVTQLGKVISCIS